MIPTEDGYSREGRATLDRIRAAAQALPGAVAIGSHAAQSSDFIDAVYGNFALMVGFIALLTFVLLARAFRSLILPLEAVVLNLLSVAAALGIIVLVWQNGHGSEAIWGIEATGAIDVLTPIGLFAFLFGLSMDYQVFIISRMREAYDRTGSTETAVVEGIGRTGRLVTSAALILGLAFVALSASPGTEVKVFATAIAAGILLDATIIRGMLVPAVVSIVGRWNWWLPHWPARVLKVEASPVRPEPARRVGSPLVVEDRQVELRPRAVAEVDHAVAEAAFVQQLELEANVVGQRLLTSADHDRARKTDGNSSTSPASKAWAASSGPPTARSRSAAAFSCRTASGSKSRSIRVLALDAVSSVLEYTILSAARQIAAKSRDHGRLVFELERLPGEHHLVQPPPVEVRPDRPLEVVDERVHLLVRLAPVELAVLVRDVAVERGDRRVDQLGHGSISARMADSDASCSVLIDVLLLYAIDGPPAADSSQPRARSELGQQLLGSLTTQDAALDVVPDHLARVARRRWLGSQPASSVRLRLTIQPSGPACVSQ